MNKTQMNPEPPFVPDTEILYKYVGNEKYEHLDYCSSLHVDRLLQQYRDDAVGENLVFCTRRLPGV